MLEAKIIIDVISNENGTYDAYIATESSSGSHYDAINAETIGSYTADLIDSLEKEESGKSYIKENGTEDIKQYLDIIEKKGKEIRKKGERAESVSVRQINEAHEKVKTLFPRVNALLMLANRCVEEGIEFPKCNKTFLMGYGEVKYGFESDVICSNLGFVPRNARYSDENAYNCIGILHDKIWADMCDIFVDGNEVFFYKKGKGILSLGDGKFTSSKMNCLNRFLKEFNSFESAFYKWIESLG